MVIVSTFTKVGKLPKPESGLKERGLISLVVGFGKEEFGLYPDDHKLDSL
jgi:hypothetical protein